MEFRKDDELLFRCCEHVKDYHPIFQPTEQKLVGLIINHHFKKTLYVEVSLTMSILKEEFSNARLSVLVKKVVYQCNLCKRYRV